MKSIADGIKIPVECASCRKKTPKSLAELKRNPVVHCACGARIQVNGASEAASPFDQLEKNLEKLGARRVR